MHFLKTSAAIFALLATSGVASAQAISTGMPSEYYDELNAKLIAQGYDDVLVTDIAAREMLAYAPNGKKVLLVAHPTSRTIVSMTYLHPGAY